MKKQNNGAPRRPTDEELKSAVRVKVTASGTPYVSRSTAALGPREVYAIVENKLRELGKLKR